MHPQEVAALAWLAGKPGVLPDGVQAPWVANTTDRFAFTDPSDVSGQQVVNNVYPSLIGLSSWIILDNAIVHSHRTTINIDNYPISYAYPIGLLKSNKDLVYNNGGAEIYR